MDHLNERMSGIVEGAFIRRFEKYVTEGVLLHGHHVDVSGMTYNAPLEQIKNHAEMRSTLKERGFKKKQDPTHSSGEMHTGKVEGVPHSVELRDGRAVISSDIGGSVSDDGYQPSGVMMEIGRAHSAQDLGRQLDISAEAAKGNC